MKKGEVPQLKYSWWDKAKPSTLPKTGLGKALKEYETAAALVKDDSDAACLKSAVEAIDKVQLTASAAASKVSKLLFKDTIDCLKKYHTVIQPIRGRWYQRMEDINRSDREFAALCKKETDHSWDLCKQLVELRKSAKALLEKLEKSPEEMDPKETATEAGELKAGGAKLCEDILESFGRVDKATKDLRVELKNLDGYVVGHAGKINKIRSDIEKVEEQLKDYVKKVVSTCKALLK